MTNQDRLLQVKLIKTKTQVNNVVADVFKGIVEMIAEIPKEVSNVIRSQRFDSELRNRIEEWAHDAAFYNFLAQNAKKIAAKLKSSTTTEDQRDVGLELFVARIFLIVGCQITYEPSRKGPDFRLELDHEYYFCEVRRIRENLPMLQNEVEHLDFDSRDFRKIGDIICEKFLRLEMENPSIIYIRSNRFLIEKIYLDKALHEFYKKADAKDSKFFVDKGFKDEQDFINRVSACSAIILEDLWSRSNSTDTIDCICQNEQSRYPLSENMLKVIMKAMAIPFKKL